MSIATCAVTGLIVGDSDACGDCDPCIMGQSSVPDVVKRLMKDRDEWREKYANVMYSVSSIRWPRKSQD